MPQLPVNSAFGSFHIVRHIGGGGMAQIYLAKTRGLAGFEKHLALKVINPEYADEERFVQMLIDEAKLSVSLSHVNIGQVFDLGQVGGVYYIAMEFVDGLDVLELVNGLHAMGEKVPVEAVAFIGRQMCSGLHYAHSRKDKNGTPLGLVHRDISPQNILVSRAGEVKVVDFGIAKAAGMSSRTHAGVIKGKVHYMAPEQALGQKMDHRGDIFSAGIVLWEMLTSQMLYTGDNMRALVEKVRRAEIPAPSSIRPEIPQSLDAIVLRALSRRPEDRFQTAHEFQVELTKFLSSTAPDYSGSHLAALVERVISRRRGPVEEVDSRVSREDLIEDLHSVIRGSAPAAGPSQPARLVVMLEEGEVEHVLQDELVIGRAGNLAIPDARVSRRHARIVRRGEEYYLEDLGSSNGSYLNEQRIAAAQLLHHGDTIRVGSCRMRFVLDPVDEGAPEVKAPPVATPRLRIAWGERTVEKVLDRRQGFELTYKVQIGPLRIEGAAGRVVSRPDGFWVEPLPGREPLVMGDGPLTSPLRLQPGSIFSVGKFTFEYCE